LLSMLMSQSRRPREMERLLGGGLTHMSMASHVRRSMWAAAAERGERDRQSKDKK
jgi:hypothetical protein